MDDKTYYDKTTNNLIKFKTYTNTYYGFITLYTQTQVQYSKPWQGIYCFFAAKPWLLMIPKNLRWPITINSDGKYFTFSENMLHFPHA